MNVTASVYIEQAGIALVAAAVTDGGCLGGVGSGGFTFAVTSDGRWKGVQVPVLMLGAWRLTYT